MLSLPVIAPHVAVCNAGSFCAPDGGDGRRPSRCSSSRPRTVDAVFGTAGDRTSSSADPAEVSTGARKMPISAKDWQPLADAFATHVRQPLMKDPTVNAEWRQSGRYPLPAARGQVYAGSERLAALSYTLSYACMHFDALCTLMDTQEFRAPMLSALQRGDEPLVLHVDFGCGPGTASWASMNFLSCEADLTTIGHDHNPHMVELARSMTDHVGTAMTATCLSEFLHNWQEFQQTVLSFCDYRWSAVLVTANSLFGQVAMRDDDINAIAAFIGEIRERTQDAVLLVAGTHPPYSEVQVESAWQRIAHITGANSLYDARLNIVSGTPRRYTAPTWVVWQPPPQLAHLYHVVGAGERT